MSQSSNKMITQRRNKHLSFMFNSSKRFGMDYSISVSLKISTKRTRFFKNISPFRIYNFTCKNREIFFLDFFTFLILADILILLISYWFYTDFGNLARNTGFVLSTVVIRVAISSPGVSSMLLFVLSGIIGIAIIRISSINFPKPKVR